MLEARFIILNQRANKMRFLKKISICRFLLNFNNTQAKLSRKRKGFSLIEVVIGIGLVGVALMGLAQLFTYSVLNNSRADRITNATFLAQEQIDMMRNLTSAELSLAAAVIDEQIDINKDTTFDYRRITQLQASGSFWDLRVMVFSAEQIGADQDDLIQNPSRYRVKADMSTIISR